MDKKPFKTYRDSMQTRIFDDCHKGSKYVARQIASLIEERNKAGRQTVLGLATGKTPLEVYQELVRIHREESLSFKRVITFNLDEYFPISHEDCNSYHRFMYDNLFSHIDIEPHNINIPDGTVPQGEIEAFCAGYEDKIKSLGGIDIQILGIGRSGHIGFNEPGSLITDITRLIKLHHLTIDDASDDFGGVEYVPKQAITMGVSSILSARIIFLLAWGERKAEVIRRAIEELISSEVPASFLQQHSNTVFVLDKIAASHLSISQKYSELDKGD
ncbi:MAG TPA: glucosamine-6-phosphate deaminase [Marinilabiliaceae bacterium]|nr:glucosamine-6-phosphate deaminase [Marinilabiliaceae bacterium]